MSARYIRIVTVFILATVVAACTPQVQGLASKVERPWKGTYLYAHSFSADPVYERDLQSFTSFWSTRFGRPDQSFLFGHRSPHLRRPDKDATEAALKELAKNARKKKDLVVVMLAAPGYRNGLMVQPLTGRASRFSARQVRRLLDPVSGHNQLIVIQACHSGRLVRDLAAPNRIIITSASAGGSQAYCAPDGVNSIYMTSLVDSLQGGGSLKEIVERANIEVVTQQHLLHIPASQIARPQISIGKNMVRYWTDSIDEKQAARPLQDARDAVNNWDSPLQAIEFGAVFGRPE